MRVDFHTHTMWSGDSTTTPDEFAQCLSESGIDVVCITDHNAVRGAQQLQGTLDARVVVGEEMKTHAGEIIGLFLTDRVPQGLAPVTAARAVKSQGGLVYIPHPFDPLRNNLRHDVLDELVGDGLVDGIEVLNAKTSLTSLNARAARYAGEHGLAPGAGSDAHVAEHSGAPTSRCRISTTTIPQPSSHRCVRAGRSAITTTHPVAGDRALSHRWGATTSGSSVKWSGRVWWGDGCWVCVVG